MGFCISSLTIACVKTSCVQSFFFQTTKRSRAQNPKKKKKGFVWLTTSKTHDWVLQLLCPSQVQKLWTRIFYKLKGEVSIHRMHSFLAPRWIKFWLLLPAPQNKKVCTLERKLQNFSLSAFFNLCVKVRFPGYFRRFLDSCPYRGNKITPKAAFGNPMSRTVS